MSGRVKGAPADDKEAARALARELHEAIKDGRRVQREITEAVIVWSDRALEMADTANAAMDNTAKKIIEELQQIDSIVKEHADELTQTHARVLGMQSPAEVIKLVAINLTEILQPVILKFVAEQLPAIVVAEMDELARKGNSKYGETLREVVVLADFARKMKD